MDKHFLDNMIFNLEERKDLKKVEFTQKAVIEVLGYLKELSKIKSEEQEEDRRVADLEQQLAESEKEIDRLKSKEKKIRLHTKRDWFERCCRLEDESIILGFEDEELKQQLAEKEKELKFVKEVKAKELGSAMALVIENLSEQIKNIDETTLLDILKRCNQDKIDFAVAELEKAKEEFNCVYSNDTYTPYQIADKIDNQIKQLKEKK